jgi:hypothetical protein
MLFTFVIGQCFTTMLCSMRYGVFLFFAGAQSSHHDAHANACLPSLQIPASLMVSQKGGYSSFNYQQQAGFEKLGWSVESCNAELAICYELHLPGVCGIWRRQPEEPA